MLLPTNEVWGKVMFLHLSVCPQDGRCCDVTSCYGQHPPPSDSTSHVTVEELALRILVDCFLVVHNVLHKYKIPFPLHEQSWYRTALLKCTVFILQIALLGTIAMMGCQGFKGWSTELFRQEWVKQRTVHKDLRI